MIDINWLMQRACRLGVTFDRGKAIIPPTITIVKTNIGVRKISVVIGFGLSHFLMIISQCFFLIATLGDKSAYLMLTGCRVFDYIRNKHDRV